MEHQTANKARPASNANAVSERSRPSVFPVQAKLSVGPVDDPLEKEADKVADDVMSMSPPDIQAKPMPVSSIQRKCEHCEEEEKQQLQRKEGPEEEEDKDPLLQRKEGDPAEEKEEDEPLQRKEINEEEEKDPLLQRKETAGQDAPAAHSVENYVGSLNGGGQTLPEDTRGFFESRFGQDFSDVRVHTDGPAAESSKQINAQAYTYGKNVVFNEGKYAPDTSDGKKLLAHELTHVVQQQGGNSGTAKGDAASTVHRKPETRPMPGWGSSVINNQSKMTLNPVARLIVDGKPAGDNWDLACGGRAAFKAPKCAKSGSVQIVVGGYWFQNNVFGNEGGEGQVTVNTDFDVSADGKVHFKAPTTTQSVQGTAAKMTGTGAASDNPDGGTLTTQVGIESTTSKSSGVTGGGSGGLTGEGGSVGIQGGANRSVTTGSGTSMSCGYAIDLTMEKKDIKPESRSQPVYFQVGKHKVIGAKEREQPQNIKDIKAFVDALPPDVRKELEEGSGDRKAKIEVVAQASVTTPRNPDAGFNLELSEKRRDAIVRVLQDFLGGAAKIKARAIGELEAVDPGESAMERVGTISVSWENDPCLTPAAKP